MCETALSQVLPALVARLPLKEDMEENKTVFSCLAMLYNHSPDLVLHTVSVPCGAHALFQKASCGKVIETSKNASCILFFASDGKINEASSCSLEPCPWQQESR